MRVYEAVMATRYARMAAKMRGAPEFCETNRIVAKKRGPKTDPNALHNATIRVHGDLLQAGGNTILAGGGRLPEKLIPTPGGIKTGRRPDILFRTPKGLLRGRNVGHADRFGNPIKRELDALNDLNGAGGIPTDFVPLD